MQTATASELTQHLQPAKKVLIVEDEVLFARAVVKQVKKAGYPCEHAENITDGVALIKQFEPDLVLLDMRLPDGNGIDLLADLVSQSIPTIVMTAYGDVSDAVHAMKIGAIDYLKKPIDLNELLLVVKKNEKLTTLQTSVDYAKQRNTHETDAVELIGDSVAMQSVRQQIARIAQLSEHADGASPTILLIGETGTGKDVAARYIHNACAQSDKPFVQIDCASLPAELIENELFGHEKGAFTNATVSRPGLIESAEDGTLFLDEIGELPLSLQAKLLNVLERRVVRRLGSTKERSVPARIIAATNRDLQTMVQEGRFRSDLYYRLNVITMTMPPLREREGDIVQLAQYFKQQTERRYGLDKREFSSDAMIAMQQYPWSGNVRELQHQISRAVLLSTKQYIDAQDLALSDVNSAIAQQNMLPSNTEQNLTLDSAEKTMLVNALAQTGNNVSKAARVLGITRMTMRYRMKKHNISA